MITTNFFIERAKSSEPVRILFFLTDKGRKYKLSTAQKIEEKYWNARKQRVKPNYTGSVELNAFLDDFEERISNIYKEAQLNNIVVSSQYLKAKLDEQNDTNKKVAIVIQNIEEHEAEQKKSFWEIFDQFIETSAITKANATIKTYKTLRTHLQSFKKKTHYNVCFDNINTIFRDKLHNYLITQAHQSDTAIQKNFQVLKVFLNYATEYGYNNCLEFRKFKFKRADVVKVALTESELQTIKQLDLADNERLEKVRDMFLFMCVTSLRYSDMQALKPSSIQSTNLEGQDIKYLDLIAQKTRGDIQAPLSAYALQLIENYKDHDNTYCFPRISNQKFNFYLKEIAQRAEINEVISVVRFVGTKRIETDHPKYELVTCHTARRTFVTQFFEKGGNSTACMVFTGHKDSKELETYRKKTLQHRLKLTRDFASVPLS